MNKSKLFYSFLLVFTLASCQGAGANTTSTSKVNTSVTSSTKQENTQGGQVQNTNAPNENPGPNNPGGENPGSENQGSENQGSENNGSQSNDVNGTENDINFTDYSTLPAINVTTAIDETTQAYAAIDSLETYTSCKISVANCNDAYALNDITAGIRLRGNSTSQFAKKPYRIKFEKKQNMLGLNNGNKYKSWVLLADWNDASYSRNYFSLHLGDAMENMEFSSDSCHVEVFINGQYKGIYLLAEQVQVNSYRVDVDTEGEDDGTITDTGYLLELEASTTRRANEGAEGEAWFKLDEYVKADPITDAYKVADNTVAYYVVKSDARSAEQMAYIKNYMTEVYKAIYKTKTREAIESLVDIKTAIDMYVIQLLVNDVDGNYSSIYVYKDKGGKLKFGPPWDFDNGYMGDTNSTTFYHLLNDLYNNYDWFAKQVNEKIVEYCKAGGTVDQVFEATKAEAKAHEEAFNNREYKKWRSTSNSNVMNEVTTFGNWITNHKKWIASKYKVDLS